MAIDATLTGAFEAFGRRVELATGGDYRHFKGRTSEATIFGFGPLVSDVFAYDPALYPNPRTTSVRKSQSLLLSATNQSGWFASTKVYLDSAWSVIAGARVSRNSFSTDNFSGDDDDELMPAGSEAFSSSGKITPYAGVVYAFNPRYSLYASYADIYQSVGHYLRSSGDLLRPADGVVIETGIKSAWREGLLNGTLAVYRVRQYGLPLYDMSAPPDSLLTTGCCFVPDAARTSKGVDAELSGTFEPGWLLGAGYTFNNNQSDREAPQLSAETPRHLMKIWISGQLPGRLRRFTVGGTLHAQSTNSKTGVDICPFNRFPCAPALIVRDVQRSYAVVDLRVGYQVDSHWQAAVTIGNLLDRSYLQTVGFPNGENWYGEPRSFLFRLDGWY